MIEPIIKTLLFHDPEFAKWFEKEGSVESTSFFSSRMNGSIIYDSFI